MDKIQKTYREHPLDIPTKKNILLLDGEYGDHVKKDEDGNYSIGIKGDSLYGKLLAMDRIFPHTISLEEAKFRDCNLASFHDFLSSENDLTPIQRRLKKDKLRWEFHHTLSQFYFYKLKVVKITFYDDEEMSLEYFSALIDECGYPEYIIVSDYFTYEHLPTEGRPKEIETSEGIIEAWEIGGVTIFYMPLSLYMSDEQIELWHQVLSEILVLQ